MPLIRKPTGSAVPPSPDKARVLDLLAHGSQEERWSAARAASEFPDSVPAIASALERETHHRVIEALFNSLSRIATKESVEAVLPHLRSDDAHVRAEAVGALSAVKAVAWPYLPALLTDADADVRILACELARGMPGEQATRLFCDLLEAEPEPNVCASVIEVLAEIGSPAALPTLERCGERFSATPFLAFSIKIAADRIRAKSPEPRA